MARGLAADLGQAGQAGYVFHLDPATHGIVDVGGNTQGLGMSWASSPPRLDVVVNGAVGEKIHHALINGVRALLVLRACRRARPQPPGGARQSLLLPAQRAYGGAPQGKLRHVAGVILEGIGEVVDFFVKKAGFRFHRRRCASMWNRIDGKYGKCLI